MNKEFFDGVFMGIVAVGMTILAIWTSLKGIAGWGMRYRYMMVPPKKALITDKIHLWIFVVAELLLALTISLILVSKRSL